MSTFKNHVQLIGRLGADAEIKSTAKGRPYAQLRFATNEYLKTSSGEWKDNTQWHNLVVWGDLTRVLSDNGVKGSQLLVQGSLQYREYTDSQNNKRIISEINVQRIMPFYQDKTRVNMEDDKSREVEADLPF